jgi:hypothetical protein
VLRGSTDWKKGNQISSQSLGQCFSNLSCDERIAGQWQISAVLLRRANWHNRDRDARVFNIFPCIFPGQHLPLASFKLLFLAPERPKAPARGGMSPPVPPAPPRFRRNEEPLPLIQTTKARSLFAYLVLNRRTTHSRAVLAGVFWPDMPEEDTCRRLRQALWHIARVVNRLPLGPYLLRKSVRKPASGSPLQAVDKILSLFYNIHKAITSWLIKIIYTIP